MAKLKKFKEEIKKEIITETETDKILPKPTIESDKIIKDLEKKFTSPSGWSESYYGFKREGEKYVSKKTILIEEDEQGKIEWSVE